MCSTVKLTQQHYTSCFSHLVRLADVEFRQTIKLQVLHFWMLVGLTPCINPVVDMAAL